jgi:excisionase family DNA binding protein
MERCHPKTILRALRSGHLDGYRVGRDWRISQLALESYRKQPNGGPVEIFSRRVALVRSVVNGAGASLNDVVEETGLRRAVVQDCLRRLGYSWATGEGSLRRKAG